jgi:hypothetical protein
MDAQTNMKEFKVGHPFYVIILGAASTPSLKKKILIPIQKYLSKGGLFIKLDNKIFVAIYKLAI